MVVLVLLSLAAVQRPDSLNLADALARARTARGQALAARALVVKARGVAGLGSLVPNPSVQYELDDLAPTRKATIVQPLGWLLRNPWDRSAGSSGVRSAVADSVQLIADLGRDVRRAFYSALAAREQRRLVDEQAALADSLVRLAERRVTAGDISELERNQVAQEAALARLTASRAREASQAADLGLARAVGWPGFPPPVPYGAFDEGLDGITDAPPGLTHDEVTALPAVRAAAADSSSAAARLHASQIARLPVPSFVIGREWRGGTGDNVILGLAFPFPIWNQGGAAASEARGRYFQSAARATEARLEMTMQLADARVRLRESAARARIARDSLLPAGQRLRDGALRLFQAERTGILPVFEALRSERQVAQVLLDELLAFQEARADLAAILGQWE